MEHLPSFSSLWANYPNGDPDAVKSMIGGHVNATWITNTCVIRLCYALNHSGYHVHGDSGLHVVSGKDGLMYGYRVAEFKPYLEHHFGAPRRFGTGAQTGIICFEVHGWSDATGHFDLWDGGQCRHEGYFDKASAVWLWPCA
jgi:hypothetical protein